MVIENPSHEAAKQLQTILTSVGVLRSELDSEAGEVLRRIALEIERGGAALRRNEEGMLVRESHLVRADVLYLSADNGLLRLVEKKQVFKDGFEHSRQLETSISTVGRPYDDYGEFVMRVVRFGLGIEGALRIRALGSTAESLDSSDYPGLPSMQITHRYAVILSDRQFKPDGYVEDQDDMETHYVWEHVPREATHV
jgi:hypothetical protein